MSDVRISFPSPCSESWDEMRPSGCNRFCATCSKTIHNLSDLAAHEVERLLRDPQSQCVRAEVRPDGTLLLKPNGRNQRKIMIAVGASVSLFTSACETLPHATSPTGLIVGKVDPTSGVKSVRAIDENGRTYRTKVLDDGTYRFKPLPYGSYSLKFVSDCGSWNGDRVVLQESERSVAEPSDTQGCIIVGMAKIEDNRA